MSPTAPSSGMLDVVLGWVWPNRPHFGVRSSELGERRVGCLSWHICSLCGADKCLWRSASRQCRWLGESLLGWWPQNISLYYVEGSRRRRSAASVVTGYATEQTEKHVQQLLDYLAPTTQTHRSFTEPQIWYSTSSIPTSHILTTTGPVVSQASTSSAPLRIQQNPSNSRCHTCCMSFSHQVHGNRYLASAAEAELERYSSKKL